LKTILHKAASRGHFDHGWLQTYHSFSFGAYYDPERVSFGMLRVLNDDVIAPQRGFGRHPHENMEIVTVPLRGKLQHRDSEGHEQIIRPNDVQVMSAGSGILHSEVNGSASEVAGLLQIWILPDRPGQEPRYAQHTFSPEERRNRMQTLVAPKRESAPLWLNQDAYFYRAALDPGASLKHALHEGDRGIYLFAIAGELEVAGEHLAARDGLGAWKTEQIELVALTAADVLAIEIPMN